MLRPMLVWCIKRAKQNAVFEGNGSSCGFLKSFLFQIQKVYQFVQLRHATTNWLTTDFRTLQNSTTFYNDINDIGPTCGCWNRLRSTLPLGTSRAEMQQLFSKAQALSAGKTKEVEKTRKNWKVNWSAAHLHVSTGCIYVYKHMHLHW